MGEGLRTTIKFWLLPLYCVWVLLMVLTPWDLWTNTEVALSRANAAPSVLSPLGADNMGRDVLGRLALSVRTNIPMLWLASLLSLGAGWILASLLCALENRVPSGVIAPIDWLLGLISGVPIFLLVFAWAVTAGVIGHRPVMYSLGLLLVFSSCFHLRCLYKEYSCLGYWESYRSMGGGFWKQLWNYGFCQDWKPHLVSYTCWILSISVVCEVSLSYLGFGIQEPEPSLGNMLAAHFNDYLHGHFRVLVAVVSTLIMVCSIPYVLSALYQKRQSSTRDCLKAAIS